MLADLSYTIADTSAYLSALPLLVGLLSRRWHSQGQRLLFYLVVAVCTTELLSYLVRKTDFLQPIIYYFFTIFEFNILLLIFRQALVPFIQNKWFLIAGISFTCFVILDMLVLSGFDQFNTYSAAVESLLLISMSLIFFYKTLRDLSIEHLERSSIFWISVAVILYFSSSLFIFLFSNQVQYSLDALYILWGCTESLISCTISFTVLRYG